MRKNCHQCQGIGNKQIFSRAEQHCLCHDLEFKASSSDVSLWNSRHRHPMSLCTVYRAHFWHGARIGSNKTHVTTTAESTTMIGTRSLRLETLQFLLQLLAV